MSAQDEKIYEFIEQESAVGALATDICVLSRKYPVPAGMQEYIAIDVKRELAKEMAEKYPIGFFALLNDLAAKATESTALEYLAAQMEQIEATFDLKKLSRLREEAGYAYFHRKITLTEYENIRQWLKAEERFMEDAAAVKDIFEKTFYALAYEESGQIKYVINARKGYIYQKKNELEQRGIFVAPLYKNTCYYNYDLRLPEVRKVFEKEAREYLTKEYLTKTQSIYTKNTRISAEKFAEIVDQTAHDYGNAAKETLKHYGLRWGVI